MFDEAYCLECASLGEIPTSLAAGAVVGDADLLVAEADGLGGNFVGVIATELVAGDDDILQGYGEGVVFLDILLDDGDRFKDLAGHRGSKQQRRASIGSAGDA